LKIEKVTFAFLTPFTMAQRRVTSRQQQRAGGHEDRTELL